ncbi:MULTISPECIES: hypothetical protein [Kribbella]|uniref:Uncharacterized protein n=1 Tax=Kribbella karoonensis TaxID=324851 RepID=A0ABN2EEP6_9ACTN
MRVGLALLGAVALTGCTSVNPARTPTPQPTAKSTPEPTREVAPQRFRIVPDDYHVPYAGTAQDGRKFFLSDELFAGNAGYVGLYLWNADGTFDEVKADVVRRTPGVPPAQAASAGADALIKSRLAELGNYKLEPIDVAPFTTKVDGTTFGWILDQFEGQYSIHIEPGDFIAYYAPWDGLGYDT